MISIPRKSSFSWFRGLPGALSRQTKLPNWENVGFDTQMVRFQIRRAPVSGASRMTLQVDETLSVSFPYQEHRTEWHR